MLPSIRFSSFVIDSPTPLRSESNVKQQTRKTKNCPLRNAAHDVCLLLSGFDIVLSWILRMGGLVLYQSRVEVSIWTRFQICDPPRPAGGGSYRMRVWGVPINDLTPNRFVVPNLNFRYFVVDATKTNKYRGPGDNPPKEKDRDNSPERDRSFLSPRSVGLVPRWAL